MMKERIYADGGRPLGVESGNALRAVARNLQASIQVVSDPATKARMLALAARYVALAEREGAND